MTGRETCEFIKAHLVKHHGAPEDMNPEDIWNASKDGSLVHVGVMYWEARAHEDNKDVGICLRSDCPDHSVGDIVLADKGTLDPLHDPSSFDKGASADGEGA